MNHSSESVFPGQPLLPGHATGTTLVLTQPLNAWGGLDPHTGQIVHHSHPQKGADISGTVLVLEETRGSGTNAQIFAQTWAEGHGPAGIILLRPDFVLSVGAVVSTELYATTCPILVVSEAIYETIQTGMQAEITATMESATVRIASPSHLT
jgi:predicted aconitase with swiveling domain